MSGGTGDGDMYVRFGSAPGTTSGTYDCRPYLSGNNESCNFAAPQAGTWYVTIRAYSAFSGVSLVGDYSTGGGGSGDMLQNGVPVPGLAATRNNWTQTYKLVVPSGAKNLSIAIAGGSGDADLYVRIGADPTTGTFTCRPYRAGNNESCTWATPTPGTYHVKVRAYQTFSGVTLTPSFTP
ncbi:MAG: PPC domain-containing protein [Dokdonella sp.]|nr:PPC domain-containing protein [Dokdonella sp.]